MEALHIDIPILAVQGKFVTKDTVAFYSSVVERPEGLRFGSYEWENS